MTESAKLKVYLSWLEGGRLQVSASPADERTATYAGWIIDSLTSRYGSQPARPDETGAITRELAPDITAFGAEQALQGAGFEVVYDSPVAATAPEVSVLK